MSCNRDPYEDFLAKWSQILKEKSDKKKTVRFFFELEDWVLEYSTRGLAILVILAGVLHGMNVSGRCIAVGISLAEGIVLPVSGLLGIILSMMMKKKYDERKDEIYRDTCAEVDKKVFSGK